MYEPRHFKIEAREEILSVIRAHPLGLLVTTGENGIEANPIPFTLAKDGEGRDVLRCHLARANAQWKSIGAGSDALVVFQGMDHYVTPSWYAAKREHGKVVPTWNYVHVQVRGQAYIREDAEFLLAQLNALTDQNEAGRKAPWKVSDAPEAYLAAQLRGIVGIEITIQSLSGKYKLSQNRTAEDFAGVTEGLGAETDAGGPVMAAFIAEKSGLIRP